MTAQYDKIGEDYAKITGSIAKRYTAGPLFLRLLGKMRKFSRISRICIYQDVLDVACGAGHFTREIRRRGAGTVVGVDISQKMIELARAEEEREPHGITYEVCDAVNLDELDIGLFDVVTGTFLLHYAKSEEDLRKMCRNIYNRFSPFNMRSDDPKKFLAINMNPDNNVQQPNPKYGMTTDSNVNLQNGDKIQWTLCADGREASFETYYWDKPTYERALRDAGFGDIVWHPMEVTEEGIEQFGEEYWEDYLENPTLTVLEAIRKGDEDE